VAKPKIAHCQIEFDWVTGRTEDSRLSEHEKGERASIEAGALWPTPSRARWSRALDLSSASLVFQNLAGSCWQACRLAGWRAGSECSSRLQPISERPTVLDSVSVAAKPAGTFAASANRWPARFSSDAKAGESRATKQDDVPAGIGKAHDAPPMQAPGEPQGSAHAGGHCWQAGRLAGRRAQPSWLLANGRARCVEMEGRGMP